MTGATAGARRDGRKRRDQILDAALLCFNERGLLGTGIEHIRREAGASPSSIYHHYGSLEQIVLALLARTFEDLFAHLAQRVSAVEPGEEEAERLVRALVDGHLEWIVEHTDQGRFMYQAMVLEGAGLSDDDRLRLQQVKEAALGPVLGRLGPHVLDGTLPAWPVELLDTVMLGVAHESLRRWLAGSTDLTPAWMRATLPGLAWETIRRA